MDKQFFIGMDVGSTTVKAVVVDPATDQILWTDYQRHDTKQPEKVLEFLQRIETEVEGFQASQSRIFITGSGGNGMSKYLGAKFVQEVNAVSLAVEKLYPECGSVIELGGQDAKIIIFKEDPETGRKKKIPSMNDKCAGGTGAVIDKINAKLRIPSEQLCEMGYKGLKLHPVAGKCGVFAETDINGLQKMGVPPDRVDGLAVRSHRHAEPFGADARQYAAAGGAAAGRPQLLHQGHARLLEAQHPENLGRAQHAAAGRRSARGSDPHARQRPVLRRHRFGRVRQDGRRRGRPVHRLGQAGMVRQRGPRRGETKRGGTGGLAKDAADLARFKEKYRTKKFVPATFQPGDVVEGFVGIDGGSTSTKAVLLSKDKERRILAKTYQLSKGNPIEDTIEVMGKLEQQIAAQGATLKVLGVGTTGYAKDILKDVIGADAALVETVAHTQAGLHFYDDVDVICDVGGQDIKIIILQDGRVKDFKLNTQCSAGNGYFLQSTAQGFNVPRGAVCRHGVRRQRLCRCSATAARCSCSPTSWISSGRDGSRKRSWPACATCCPRTSGCTFRRFPTSRPSAGASCCKAARSTTWPR